MTSTDSNSPIFVVGSHRSGTTLLRYLLHGHPNLGCPPEPKFLLGLEAAISSPQVYAGLRGLGFSRKEIYEHLQVYCRTVFDSYLARHGKSRFVDKTPNYFRILPFIDEIFQQQARYLVIVRHPLDCVASLTQYFFIHKNHDDPDIARFAQEYGTDRESCARYWNDVYRKVRWFSSTCEERVHTIRYEDLTAAPHETMGAIFDFLGEERFDVVSNCFSQEHDAGFGDRKIRSATMVDPSRVGKWKQWRKAESSLLWEAVQHSAEHFGYHRPSSEY